MRVERPRHRSGRNPSRRFRAGHANLGISTGWRAFFGWIRRARRAAARLRETSEQLQSRLK
ncbi:hypothetical protein BURPS305_3045 [Burkholderia pseudomallei 305]|nr:hypothetical protein BURPS305_3045 [Burkholderia pseudomallei 305]